MLGKVAVIYRDACRALIFTIRFVLTFVTVWQGCSHLPVHLRRLCDAERDKSRTYAGACRLFYEFLSRTEILFCFVFSFSFTVGNDSDYTGGRYFVVTTSVLPARKSASLTRYPFIFFPPEVISVIFLPLPWRSMMKLRAGEATVMRLKV